MTDVKRQVSPEYRAKCIEWALRTQPGNTAAVGKAVAGADAIIAAAKKYYEYVYEGDTP